MMLAPRPTALPTDFPPRAPRAARPALPRLAAAAVGLALSVIALARCASPEIVPLEGEDPEVYQLIGASAPDDPAASPLFAARRLHQALMQDDSATVWRLLATPTQRALDERGASIGASGRELLDASTLPAPGGTVQKVRYEHVFFGVDIVDLRDPKRDVTTDFGNGRAILAVGKSGAITELTFLHEEDAWKLVKTKF
ncbi:MAG: hypothetical protein KC635_22665 [Myxococcales bacterium]|nr:hypothetical protein [Myxococcales bacterium]MCB9736354.1 hypothetical protein [Deltaproteobacteria bacterium]